MRYWIIVKLLRAIKNQIYPFGVIHLFHRFAKGSSSLVDSIRPIFKPPEVVPNRIRNLSLISTLYFTKNCPLKDVGHEKDIFDCN